MLTENYTGQAGTEVTYAYDSGTDGVGRLSSATTTAGATQYQYNPLGLTKSETKTISGTSFTTSYDYDRQGNQTLITYPDQAQVRNTYNTAGQLDKVEEKENGGSFANVVDNIDYGPHGKPIFKDYANGTESIYTYDANELYRLNNILTDHSGGMGGSLEDLTLDSFQLLADEAQAPAEPFMDASIATSD